MEIDFEPLLAAARNVVGYFKTDGYIDAGGVGAAILSSSGAVYTGICVDAACGIGFCAEHSAIAEMLKQREFRIIAAVAVDTSGVPVPPCGRCRELMHQLSPDNRNTVILISANRQRLLGELLPEEWDYNK